MMGPDEAMLTYGPMPLVDAWLRARSRGLQPLQIPGHKYRYSPDAPGTAPGYAILAELVGADIALQGGLDDNAMSGGYLIAAERLWAQAVHATHARFLVGGSSQGNLGMVAAVASMGNAAEVIAVDRSSHRSVLGGLIIGGAEPVWVQPKVHTEFGIPLGLDPADVADLPPVNALVVTSPAYVGTLSDLAGLAAACHARAFPLLADQAWGAHLGFLPGSGAIAQGADISVTSVHKALLGYSQTAVVTMCSDLVEPERLDRSLDLVATTSPSGTLLASIDATRAVLVAAGSSLWDHLFELAGGMRAQLRAQPGVVVLDDETLGQSCDPLKVTLWLPRTGATGTAVAARLRSAGIGVEAADTDTLVMTLSPADAAEQVAAATEAVRHAIDESRGPVRPPAPTDVWQVVPEVVISPRLAFAAPRRRIALAAAVGEISAEQFCPYPPGVPLLAPGERVTEQIVEAIGVATRIGRVAYCSDPTATTIEVVAN
jgi:lysine decarboxylase